MNIKRVFCYKHVQDKSSHKAKVLRITQEYHESKNSEHWTDVSLRGKNHLHDMQNIVFSIKVDVLTSSKIRETAAAQRVREGWLIGHIVFVDIWALLFFPTVVMTESTLNQDAAIFLIVLW